MNSNVNVWFFSTHQQFCTNVTQCKAVWLHLSSSRSHAVEQHVCWFNYAETGTRDARLIAFLLTQSFSAVQAYKHRNYVQFISSCIPCGPWLKVVPHKGNTVPFRTAPVCCYYSDLDERSIARPDSANEKHLVCTLLQNYSTLPVPCNENKYLPAKSISFFCFFVKNLFILVLWELVYHRCQGSTGIFY